MNHSRVIRLLADNRATYQAMLTNLPEQEIHWKPAPEKWSLLEVVNHLYDEEREDFRSRVQLTLENPDQAWPSIAPKGWVHERGYALRDYPDSLSNFLNERQQSIEWLHQLEQPQWQATHLHPRLGPMSAELILANWLAHDYLHFRQINALKYGFLMSSVLPLTLAYAGQW